MSSNFEEVDFVSAILLKCSHALRTPLGVTRSVVADASLGMELSSEDFEDALEGTEQILSQLNLLQELGLEPSGSGLSFFADKHYQNITISCAGSDEDFSINLLRGLHCLCLYFSGLAVTLSTQITVTFESSDSLVICKVLAEEDIFQENYLETSKRDERLFSIALTFSSKLLANATCERIDFKTLRYEISESTPS